MAHPTPPSPVGPTASAESTARTTSAPALSRGAMLAGLGAAGVGLAAALSPGAAHAAPPGRGAAPGESGLAVLRPGDDWAEVLAATPQVQLVPGAQYVLPAAVSLPSGTVVEGHGAVLVPASRGHGIFVVEGASDVTLRGIRLHGEAGYDPDAGVLPPIDVPLEIAHTAIRSHRARNLRVLDCDLLGWRGAGIAATGDRADDYFSYGLQITGCRFEACYVGLSAADRCEYSLLASSILTACRLAVWNSSGNWNLTGNVIVGCHGAYYSIAATSPFGQLASDNWAHGALTGCTMNHSDGGTPRRWTAHLALSIGGELRDPGPGVVLEDVLPPTFSGNTLWYTSVTARRLIASVWNLTGCALSDLRITQDGGAPVSLIGHQANAGDAHAPVLVGDVRDALAP